MQQETLSKYERRLEKIIDEIRATPTIESIGLLHRFIEDERLINRALNFDKLAKKAMDSANDYAKFKHKEEYNNPSFQRDIDESELDFARGFVAGYNLSKT